MTIYSGLIKEGLSTDRYPGDLKVVVNREIQDLREYIIKKFKKSNGKLSKSIYEHVIEFQENFFTYCEWCQGDKDWDLIYKIYNQIEEAATLFGRAEITRDLWVTTSFPASSLSSSQ